MSDKIFLYHGFRNYSDVQIIDGSIPATCRGEGAGGQSDGFYVWNNIKKTTEYLGGYKCNNAVICQIEVPENEFKYPDWQLDYEALGKLHDDDYEKQKEVITKLAKLFMKYKHEAPNHQQDLSKPEHGFELIGASETKFGTRIRIIPNKKTSQRLALYEGDLSVSGCEQVLNDYMCSHSQGYLDEYNALLKESLSCFNGALKYVGNKELKVSDVFNQNGNKDRNLTNTFLPDKDNQTLPMSLVLDKRYSR